MIYRVFREHPRNFASKARKLALDNLTPREREILQLVAEEKTTREIASTLFIRPKTVEAHRSNIAKKLRKKNVQEIKEYAVKKCYLIED